jgi:hypothetical protein
MNDDPSIYSPQDANGRVGPLFVITLQLIMSSDAFQARLMILQLLIFG